MCLRILDVSVDHSAFIFIIKQLKITVCTLQMKSIKFYKSGTNRPARQRNISEDLNLPKLPSENLKSLNLNIRNHIHNSSLMDSVLSQIPETHQLLSSVFNLMLYSHLRLGLPNGLFPLGFVTKIS